MTPSTFIVHEGGLKQHISALGRGLASTFGPVLAAIPPSRHGGAHRPQALARMLGVNTVLTSRLLRAVQQQDPLMTAHLIPGPEPLRRVLKAAQRKRVSPTLLHAAAQAVNQFEHVIDCEAGDRSALDAIISDWLPDAKGKVELLARQSVFRGMSQVLGASSDLEHSAALIHPAASAGDARPSDLADQVWITATRGWRRLRPGLVPKYDTIHGGAAVRTVDGHDPQAAGGLLLEDFCSVPASRLSVTQVADRTQYALQTERIGVQSAVNLVHAAFIPDSKALWREAGEQPRMATFAVGVTMPTRTFIFDVLLHALVFAGQQPSIHMYRAMPYGPANPNDPSRDIDRLDLSASVEPLGRGLARCRTAQSPEHVDVLAHVCRRRGWDGQAFRVFRCAIPYPVCGTEVVVAFDVPARPAAMRET